MTKTNGSAAARNRTSRRENGMESLGEALRDLRRVAGMKDPVALPERVL